MFNPSVLQFLDLTLFRCLYISIKNDKESQSNRKNDTEQSKHKNSETSVSQTQQILHTEN